MHYNVSNLLFGNKDVCGGGGGGHRQLVSLHGQYLPVMCLSYKPFLLSTKLNRVLLVLLLLS